MSWFTWWRGNDEEDVAPLPYLFDGQHWWVRGVSDYGKFFSGLPLLVPQGGVVVLGAGIRLKGDQDVAELRRRSLDPDIEVVNFMKTGGDFLAINEDNLQFLIGWAERCSQVELAMEFTVLEGKNRILEWFDAPIDPLAIGPSVGEDVATKFSDMAGGYCEWRDGIV